MVAFLPFILTDWLPHSHFKTSRSWSLWTPSRALSSYHVVVALACTFLEPVAIPRHESKVEISCRTGGPVLPRCQVLGSRQLPVVSFPLHPFHQTCLRLSGDIRKICWSCDFNSQCITFSPCMHGAQLKACLPAHNPADEVNWKLGPFSALAQGSLYSEHTRHGEGPIAGWCKLECCIS